MASKLRSSTQTLFIFLGSLSIIPSQAAQIPITFFTEKIQFTSLAKYTLEVPNELDDIRLKAIADKWDAQTGIQKVAREIDSVSRQLDLCPWFRYQLIVKYVDQCFLSSTVKQKRLYEWYLLNKQGYDARIAFGKILHVFVRLDKFNPTSHDYLDMEGRRFMNLSKEPMPEYLLSRVSLNDANSIGFTLSDLRPPKLKSVMQNRQVKLNIDSLTINYQVNKTIGDLYLHYPTDYRPLFNVDLSDETRRSLLPVLCAKLITTDTLESIRLLLAFTQNVARYEDDLKIFGQEKPMAPEEVLYYGISDCEDRAALFYYLVRTFYGLPMLVLKYPAHLNVAVELPKGKYRDIVSFQGKSYAVCEPTEISKMVVLGQSEAFSKNKNPSVEKEYVRRQDVYDCKKKVRQ